MIEVNDKQGRKLIKLAMKIINNETTWLKELKNELNTNKEGFRIEALFKCVGGIGAIGIIMYWCANVLKPMLKLPKLGIKEGTMGKLLKLIWCS